MSLTALLCVDYCIGRFVGMSGYFPFREDIEDAVKVVIVDEDGPFSGDDSDEQCDPVVKASIFESNGRELLIISLYQIIFVEFQMIHSSFLKGLMTLSRALSLIHPLSQSDRLVGLQYSQ